MLVHAREKDVYHVLVNAELTEFLRDNCEAFDVIVSADTLVYFGDLQTVVANAARALRPNGLIVFTLEHAVASEPDVEYRLEHHGRYSHGRHYVEELLVAAGLRTEITHADLRMESGIPVAGLVIRARKDLA
jgi:predicted TPR repeat methyltransferase